MLTLQKKLSGRKFNLRGSPDSNKKSAAASRKESNKMKTERKLLRVYASKLETPEPSSNWVETEYKRTSQPRKSALNESSSINQSMALSKGIVRVPIINRQGSLSSVGSIDESRGNTTDLLTTQNNYLNASDKNQIPHVGSVAYKDDIAICEENILGKSFS